MNTSGRSKWMSGEWRAVCTQPKTVELLRVVSIFSDFRGELYFEGKLIVFANLEGSVFAQFRREMNSSMSMCFV